MEQESSKTSPLIVLAGQQLLEEPKNRHHFLPIGHILYYVREKRDFFHWSALFFA
jgi:hypothetical protein